MIKYIYLSIIIFANITFPTNLFAQNNLGKSDDNARISLSVYIPEAVDGMPLSAESLLKDRISMLLNNYSITGSEGTGRFIIVPVVHLTDKSLTSTTPTLFLVTLETSIIIGDGFEGIKFGSALITSKGIGQSEEKAYIDAIKKIKTQDPEIEKLITRSKQKIIEYFNSTCDFNIKRANTLAAQNQFDEAISILTNVPEVCKDCFDKSMDIVQPIFQRKIDMECNSLLQRAKAVWAANQSTGSASEVADILSGITPGASCRPQAEALVNQISKRVLELDKREWNFQLKQQQDEVDFRKATIKAARDVGVAYGNNQPRVIYKTTLIRGWW